MNRSDSIAALAKALASAQSTMPGAVKVKMNPHFKNRDADLESGVDATKTPLSKNGIAYAQFARTSEKDEIVIETILMHESGEWISGEIAIPVSKTDPQGYGSAMTYARRYSLMAAAGIAPEDDDDGEKASNSIATDDAELREYTAKHLGSLEEAAKSGMKALAAAFEQLPKSPAKQKFWQAHQAALKKTAESAPKAEAA